MAYNTILLKADELYNPNLSESYQANAGITPGHFVELLSTGKVRKHATAGGAITPLIAKENIGGGAITLDYSTDDLVQVAWLREGDEVYALLLDGENVAIGDKLESGAGGTLRKVVADTSAGTVKVGSIIATALEAVNMSGSAGADPSGRIRVKITRG